MDLSPHYAGLKTEQFNESEAVDLGPVEDERVASASLMKGSMIGKRINRYYTSLKPYFIKEFENDNTLIFESRFESGNLRRAVKVSDQQNAYNLILKYDHDTTTYTQWFYFKI